MMPRVLLYMLEVRVYISWRPWRVGSVCWRCDDVNEGSLEEEGCSSEEGSSEECSAEEEGSSEGEGSSEEEGCSSECWRCWRCRR